MKNVIFELFVCTLLVGAFFVIVPDTVRAPQDGDYIYTVSNGEATITNYTGTSGAMTIPSTLGGYPTVAIGDYAFMNTPNGITSAIIPNSITTIGEGAFYGCSSMTSVTIGNHVTIIGDYAFYECEMMFSLTIPNSVTTIGKRAFLSCENLHSISIPNSVTTIGSFAFSGCYWLSNLTIPDSITTIESNTFRNCYSLTSMTIPNSVTTIGSEAFAGCDFLTSVTIGNSVSTIGSKVFSLLYESPSLTSIAFLGLITPTTVASDWIIGNLTEIRGHAYAASNFPAPGGVWHGLTMGAYIPDSNPPVFGIPYPANGSTRNLLSLSWDIPINDFEGNTFSWTIQCSNGQVNSGIDAANGIKSLSLTSLAFSTHYKVWVNATDSSGSGLYARKWYTFTTKSPGTSGDVEEPHTITLEGLVWYDADVNGIQDEGEVGIGGIIVNIYNNYNASKGQTQTTLEGIYSFGNLQPGTYYLRFSLSTGYKFTIKDVDSDDTFDSDADMTTGKTDMFTIPTNQDVIITNWDAGMYKYREGTPEPPSNEPINNMRPTADATTGEPYLDSVNTEITFDGSRSYDVDGNITSWSWNFGDNTTGSGKIVKHIYHSIGTYQVTLIVTDNDNATDTYTTTAVIMRGNNLQPTINGPTQGHKDIVYNYTMVSNGPDNHSIYYFIKWGDGSADVNSSKIIPITTPFSCSHLWYLGGLYTIEVRAFDNNTTSQPAYLAVLIDSKYVGNLGYLIDQDEESGYDYFYSNSSMRETRFQKASNETFGIYFIDSDDDGDWDYTYNETSGLVSSYQTSPQESSKTPGFEFIFVIGAIALVLFWKRKKIIKT